MKSTVLLTSRIKNNFPLLQIEKEGLIMLRKYRNKKLRILFNVNGRKQHIQEFNANFMNKNQFSRCSNEYTMASESKQMQMLQENNSNSQYISYLEISPFAQQLTQNRVLLIFNIICSDNTEIDENKKQILLKSEGYLLILGYLIASTFLYHHEGQLSQDNHLTRILSVLYSLLKKTNVEALEKQIKFKGGFAKKPYFMCLFEKDPSTHDNIRERLRQFYRYKQNGDEIVFNQAVDTLMDYFPDRSAINMHQPAIVKKLGQQFIQSILGRQIFNFQITGSVLENLCFEFCEIYNKISVSSNPDGINLVQIYNKIITNQKMRVQDVSIEAFSQLKNNLKNKLPLKANQFDQLYQDIISQVITDSLDNASNCMDICEFRRVYSNISSIMSAKYEQLSLENYQILRDRTIKCYELVQPSQELEQQLKNQSSENTEQIYTYIFQKIKLFIDNIEIESSIKSMLNRLISSYLQNLSQSTKILLQEYEEKVENTDRIIEKLMTQNQNISKKIEYMQHQLKYTLEINEEYKSKILQSNGAYEYQSQSGEKVRDFDEYKINQLQRKVKELEDSNIEKDIEIHTLGNLLNKFQSDLSRKYIFKPKLSKDIQTMIFDVSHKINEIYPLLDSLRKTEEVYKQIETEFQSKKKKLLEDWLKDKQNLALETSKLDKTIKQKMILQDVISETRDAIRVMKDLEQQYKETIDEKQTLQARYKCLLHDTLGDMQQYKKALQLVAECTRINKFDGLKKYEKVTGIKDLKQLIRQIVKK